jgi:pimeloyl-ACP methyl ester carboxylesterase
MTRVFVHGFPETSRIWDSLRAILESDSIALALPGFEFPRPDGFTATEDAYAEWLTDRLNDIGESIDLVGHDVGALISIRVATALEVDLRSFVVDVPNIYHPDFVWPERVHQLLVRFGDDDDLTGRVVDAVQADGTCWLSGTTWRGVRAMRISVSNWSTEEEDVDRSVQAIVRCFRREETHSRQPPAQQQGG